MEGQPAHPALVLSAAPLQPHTRKEASSWAPHQPRSWPFPTSGPSSATTAPPRSSSRETPASSLPGQTLQDLRNNALALVVGEAQTLQRPVRVRIEDPEGHGELIVHPGGKIESVSYEPRPGRRRTAAPASTPAAADRRTSPTHRAPAPRLRSDA